MSNVTALSIDVRGLKETLAAANDLAKALGAEIPELTIGTLTEAAIEHVKKLTPGSGRVRGAWQLVMLGKRGNAHTAVIVNQIAATAEGEALLAILEGGSRPHRIEAHQPPQALHFFMGGHEVFAKSVDHPGTRAYQMVQKTEDYLNDYLERVKEAAAERAVAIWEAR